MLDPQTGQLHQLSNIDEQAAFIKRCLVVAEYIVKNVSSEALMLELLNPDFPIIQLIQRSLSDTKWTLRGAGLQLVGAMSAAGKNIACQNLPLLEQALHVDDIQLKNATLKLIFDIMFLFPSLQNEVCSVHEEPFIELLPQFANDPAPGIQLTAVYGMCQLLMHNVCASTDIDRMLATLVGTYFGTPPNSNEELSQTAWKKICLFLHKFFQEYAGEQNKHQTELANTLLFMVVNAVRQGKIPSAMLQSNNTTQATDNGPHFDKFKLQVQFLLGLVQQRIYAVIIDSIIANVTTLFKQDLRIEQVHNIIGI
eukprot:TRINITY_DN1272_c0_g1_i2.p1 TRINITY_DN1272_c0_g1~~TRINITY_DN1272_c0_g1_i2.p1  ORF type:complete len:310 (+),score=-35.68 TRINITY_DN1272_c0_g1_i2:233-1162(+)